MSIEKYFQSGAMNWFKEGENSRYSSFHWNEINTQTLEAANVVLEVCQKTNNPAIGIVGFGFGRETELLIKKGVKAKIIGLDINYSRFSETKKIKTDLFQDNFFPVTASMNNTPFANDTFDATLCLETMMHSDNPATTLRELTRITKPSGIIIFNMSTTQGIIRDLGHMLSVEGLPRIIVRLKERVLLTGDSSSKRTRLYSREQIEDIILKNSNTEVVETRNYLKGLSTYIVLKKSDKNKDF
jgi:ubiquinone/menaquinone biosynthesis C-methylase UbiE